MVTAQLIWYAIEQRRRNGRVRVPWNEVTRLPEYSARMAVRKAILLGRVVPVPGLQVRAIAVPRPSDEQLRRVRGFD